MDSSLKKARHQRLKDQLMTLSRSVFIGISGLTLTDEERRWLQHPLVGGVILFSRNYQDKEQLQKLTRAIKEINSALLISVDHEGGRVQRFREGFSKIAPMRSLGKLYDIDSAEALQSAHDLGRLIAAELQEVGVDFSYAPVCDLDYGVNPAIGDRAFHADPEVVSQLVLSFYEGLRSEGSIGIAKHFPGHGYVNIDTHLALARDDRDLATLETQDLLPFKRLIGAGIEGLMPAHIIFSCLDSEHTVITSAKWMQYLRGTLGFKGVIISDDLDMQGAAHLGTAQEKVEACFSSGINIVLLCNDMEAIRSLLREV